jgi:N-acetylmuramoyl-L-alanine amidase
MFNVLRKLAVVFGLAGSLMAPAQAQVAPTTIGNCTYGRISPSLGPYRAVASVDIIGQQYCYEAANKKTALQACTDAYRGLLEMGKQYGFQLYGDTFPISVLEEPTYIGDIGWCNATFIQVSWLSGNPITVAIDPGHGFTCAANGMEVGAVGVTDFPANDPPAGRLREDDLTMAIAREVERILPKSKYRVVLTKNNVNDCPTFKERGDKANIAKAKAFVSIHINKALLVLMTNWPVPYGIAHGTSVLYRAEKPESLSLAESMARNVSSSLGVNNRGVKVDELWVLSPKVTETKIAVLVESARLSGDDETKLHTSGSATRIAAGIKAALDESLGN